MFDLTYFRVEQAVGLLHRDLEVGAGGFAGMQIVNSGSA